MENSIGDVQPENAMLATAWERLELNNSLWHLGVHDVEPMGVDA